MSEGTRRTITSSELQRGFGPVLDEVRNSKNVVIVTSHGRQSVAIIGADEYKKLLAARRQLAARVTERLATLAEAVQFNDYLNSG